MSVRSRVRLLLCGGCWATCVPMRQRPGMGTVSWVKVVALGLDLSRLDGLNPAIPMLDIGHPRLETSESNCSDGRPTRSPQVICNHLRQAEKSAGRNWSPKEALRVSFGEKKSRQWLCQAAAWGHRMLSLLVSEDFATTTMKDCGLQMCLSRGSKISECQDMPRLSGAAEAEFAEHITRLCDSSFNIN